MEEAFGNNDLIGILVGKGLHLGTVYIITDIDGLTFTWQLQAKPSSKRLWKDVEGVEGNGSRAFEYTFEEGCDYRVIACISTDDGGYGSRVVAEITAEDLQTPKFF